MNQERRVILLETTIFPTDEVIARSFHSSVEIVGPRPGGLVSWLLALQHKDLPPVCGVLQIYPEREALEKFPFLFRCNNRFGCLTCDLPFGHEGKHCSEKVVEEVFAPPEPPCSVPASFDAKVWAEEFNKVLYGLRTDRGDFTCNFDSDGMPINVQLDEGFLIGWFANALMRVCNEGVHRAEKRYLSASEALFAFVAWLVVREQPTTFSSRHDASIAVELVDAFIKHNELPGPREGWADKVKPMKDHPLGVGDLVVGSEKVSTPTHKIITGLPRK